MNISEIEAKSILTPSKIYSYVINPYVGCQYGCTYCYARYMKRFTGHKEPWGGFVDVKINAAGLLRKEIGKKKKNRVWVSGVCDPYQPLEKKYRLTRECLTILFQNGWPVTIQTRSPLIIRDIDIIKEASGLEAGFTITTADDKIRKLFEPAAPPVMERIKALEELHGAGIRTYAMIAPVLPGTADLIRLLAGKVDYVLVDRMNYNNAKHIYKENNLEAENSDEYFKKAGRQIEADCIRYGIECRVFY